MIHDSVSDSTEHRVPALVASDRVLRGRADSLRFEEARVVLLD
jgi:hypothetical protein